ncbi:MAG: hypothetical protein K2P30_12400, partial [Lachnospiraceae bacterium]|nr:hypothetical protein [Lachnospiraceae bacterium]
PRRGTKSKRPIMKELTGRNGKNRRKRKAPERKKPRMRQPLTQRDRAVLRERAPGTAGLIFRP